MVLRLVTMGTYERMTQTLGRCHLPWKKSWGQNMEEHLLCCVHLLMQHTLVWDRLQVLINVLNLWHWSALPAPTGISQPWLLFTSSLPVGTKPRLVSDLSRLCSMPPLCPSMALSTISDASPKRRKKANIRDVWIHTITSLPWES